MLEVKDALRVLIDPFVLATFTGGPQARHSSGGRLGALPMLIPGAKRQKVPSGETQA